MKYVPLFLSFSMLFLAVLCSPEEEPFFSTDFIVQNSSSEDLIFVTADENDFVLESQAEQGFFLSSDKNEFKKPSENVGLQNGFRLYQRNEGGDLVMVYEQDPIDDSLWIFTEQFEYDANYKLVITDADLDL